MPKRLIAFLDDSQNHKRRVPTRLHFVTVLLHLDVAEDGTPIGREDHDGYPMYFEVVALRTAAEARAYHRAMLAMTGLDGTGRHFRAEPMHRGTVVAITPRAAIHPEDVEFAIDNLIRVERRAAARDPQAPVDTWRGTAVTPHLIEEWERMDLARKAVRQRRMAARE